MANLVEFTINGKLYTVSETTSPNTSLNSFIRNYANLRGTKAMCHEGGCGACIVTVASIHPASKEPQVYSLNSCLVPVFSCHGWSITTIEGLGDQDKGYHPIQRRLAAFNGTQCGYCSPGWVMNMHGIYENNKHDLTMAEVENSFGGNVCRCTGYRPILDAFKTFAKDCDPKLTKQIADIEEISGIKMCQKNGFLCTKSCNDYCSKTDSCKVDMDGPMKLKENTNLALHLEDGKWYKVYNVGDVFDVFSKEGAENCSILAGNSAKGVYRPTIKSKVIIDVNDVGELKSYDIKDEGIELGGNLTLTDTMKAFHKASSMGPKYSYLKQVNKHIDLIANVPVRNVGTLGGNLSIKHQHLEFQSDIFVLFAAIGAQMTIASPNGHIKLSMTEYLKADMKGKIINKIHIPVLQGEYAFKSYKITKCAQNSHAYVNVAFLLKFNSTKNKVTSASIVYGGISDKFNHAENLEKYITGRNIFDKSIQKEAMKVLSDEVNPSDLPPEASPKYRKKLAVNLFYKFLASITVNLDKNEVSAGWDFDRPISKGEQQFETKKDVWPLSKPIPKIEGLVQCAGEAKYSNDIPTMPGELYGAFVLSKVPCGIIEKIDATEVLKMKGVVALFTAKDIPGINSFMPMGLLISKEAEEIFCSEKVLYNGQVLALVVAETEILANEAAEKVNVTYKSVKYNPVLTVRQALKSTDLSDRLVVEKKMEPKTERGNDVKKVVKGSFDFYGQYHYYMETQTCVCVPTEDGIDVYPASQWMDHIQVAMFDALRIPENKVNIYVKRVGGAYGGKATRTTQVATACALAAMKLRRPVRMVLSMETNMKTYGKRLPYALDYEVGVNDSGKIQYMNSKFYADNGASHNESKADHTLAYFPNCYDTQTWEVAGHSVLTDTPCNIACRAPGTTEGVAMSENIMEHIARATGKDPLDVRMANMVTENSALPEMIEEIKKKSSLEERKQNIKNFNNDNKWRKRGLSVVPLKYNFFFWGNFYSTVSIYHHDGTVAVAHGGIEMGQGVNTKVAQVCAHTLGIPLDKIVINSTNTFTAPNNMVSGGSITSEAVAYATVKACEMLLERLEPLKKELEDPTWEALIKKAYGSNVDLCAHYMFTNKDNVTPYVIWGVAVTEVEVDFLTGNHQILRVDILEDTGESLSPQIDVGQVEGAFMMGIGYWTSEKLIYDEKTGELLTNRTWNYKPPGAKDIPQIFNIYFRRNAPNPLGVLRSKATGEPPMNMTISVMFAIRQAINAFRDEQGKSKEEWCHLEMPCTPEHVLLAAEAD